MIRLAKRPFTVLVIQKFQKKTLKNISKEARRKTKEKEERLTNKRGLFKSIAETTRISTINPHLPCLPHDLVLGNILSRLPVESLIRLCCVCKFWYKSIRSKDFPYLYFLQSQKNPILLLHFTNFGYYSPWSLDDNCFFYLNKEDGLFITDRKNNGEGTVKCRSLSSIPSFNGYRSTLVGHCNGLVCVTRLFNKSYRDIYIFNPHRHQTLFTIAPRNLYQCYGFGFDSFANEYKVVCIAKRVEADYCCHVYTWGSNSWSEITCPLDIAQFLSTNSTAKSAVYCKGALYWMSYDEITHEMLLFDLHDEKFQLIRSPFHTEQGIKPKLYHDLCQEFKGSLCCLRLEEFGSKNLKVHLHTLNDSKQEWIKENFLAHYPYNPAIRTVSFSDQVLLYYFNGECFQFHNLHTKVTNKVQVPSGGFSDEEHCNAFRRATFYDYQVYSHVANFLSLQTMASKGLDSYPSSNSSMVGKSTFLRW